MSSAQWGAPDAGRRILRRQPIVLPLRAGRARPHRLQHIIPTHQGRAAERILFHTVLQARRDRPEQQPLRHDEGQHRGRRGAKRCDLVIPEGRVPSLIHPFKGNIDLDALERAARRERRSGAARDGDGDQQLRRRPAGSLENLRGVRALCDRYRKPFFLDACRFAENAWFIKTREAGQADRTPKAIAQEMFSLADGCTMSAKKDGLANIGGFLAMNDDRWAERRQEPADPHRGISHLRRARRLRPRGDRHAVSRRWSRSRTCTTASAPPSTWRTSWSRASVPIIRPAGRARDLHRRAGAAAAIPPLAYPGIALANALYLEAGVRSVEIGTVMFGLHPDGSETPAADGSGPAGDSAARVHAVSHRLRGRSACWKSRERRIACAVTGSCRRRRHCGISRRGSSRSKR